MTRKIFFVLLSFAILFISCEQEQGQEISATVLCVTIDATAISQTSAVLNGTAIIKDAKASNANAYFYYSTTSGDAKTIKASGQRVSAGNIQNTGGDFSYNLGSLLPSTTYYYVASVGIDDVEELGSVKTFATEKKTDALSVTGVALNVTVNSASLTSYANLTADMTGDVIIGIIYSTNSSPSLQNGKLLTSKDLDGNNMYQVEVTDLTPDTKYYFKSFLSRGNLNYYGEVKEFSTAQVLASVSTLDAWDVKETKASVGGKVEVSSAGVVKREAAIYYGADGSSIEALKTKGKRIGVDNISEEGTFTTIISDLNESTQYYYVAVVLVEGVEFGGVIKNFTTADKPASISVTGDYSDLGESSVKLYGWCNQEGDEGVSVVYGIEYSDTDLTTSAFTLKASEMDSENKFFCRLTGLSSNTRYYYRSFVLYNGVRSYGEVKTFTTKEITAIVTTVSVTDIGESYVKLNGHLQYESIDNLDCVVGFLYSETAADLESLIADGVDSQSCAQNQDGTFSYALSNLHYNTTHYCIAWARVYDKFFYGDVISFTTDDIKASITTMITSEVGCTKATLSGLLTLENAITLSKIVGFVYGTESTLEQLKANGARNTTALNDDFSFSLNVTSLVPNTKYYYSAYAIVCDKEVYGAVLSFTTNTLPDGAVDLGLSVCWATRNLGASKPEEYGDYYAWGETETKSNYSWSTYKFGSNPSGPFSKYNASSSYDTKTILEPEDDVAHVKLGENWRMPTYEEWKELRTKCTWTQTTENGVNGRRVTSPNGNSIFLPAAGNRYDTDFYVVGSCGRYWSSSLHTLIDDCAIYLDFESYISMQYGDRCYGLSVRPVTE